MARQVLENGVILPAEYSDDWYDDMTSNLTKLDDVIGSDSEKLSSADVGAAALSNNYNDLDNLPTIPTVNDATLTIQKNGVDVQTFTANASSNVTCNITVPTKTSDLTNDSNFVDTSNSAVASGITSAKVTSYDSHVADTDIHVTTADKNKWNNGVTQSYVFRYSSTALVASSTNSNTLLDNTDNLKVGDKVIDSSGVLFSITAIDTANSTFTIGTALIDLAQDSDVVHKSGNETVEGEKTFTNSVTFSHGWTFWNNPSVTKGTIPQSTVYPYRCYFGGRGYANSLFNIDTSVSNTGIQTLIIRSAENVVSGDDARLVITYDPTLSQPRCIRFRGDCVPTASDTYECGTNSNKWKSLNGINPGALSFPDLNNGIDISGYITTPNAVSTYTPVVNGWVSIVLKTTSGALACFATQGDFANGHYSATSLTNETEPCVMLSMPVIGGIAVNIYTKGVNAYLYSAKFYPCQGNV